MRQGGFPHGCVQPVMSERMLIRDAPQLPGNEPTIPSEESHRTGRLIHVQRLAVRVTLTTCNIVQLQVGIGWNLDESVLIWQETRRWKTRVRQIDVKGRRLSHLQIACGVVRARFRINPTPIVQRKTGNMAISTSNLPKFPGSVLDGVANFRIAWDHPSGYGQGNLENGCSRHVCARQFVHESIAVRIRADSETFFGLYSVVVIKCVIGELADGNDVARLMVRPNDQVRRCRALGSKCGRRQADHLRSVPRAVGIVYDHPKINTLAYQCARSPARCRVPDGTEIRGHLPGNHFEVTGSKHADGLTRICDGLQPNRITQFVHSAASRNGIEGIKCGEVEALPQNEYIANNVAAAANIGFIMATRAGVRVRPRDAVEIAWEHEGTCG